MSSSATHYLYGNVYWRTAIAWCDVDREQRHASPVLTHLREDVTCGECLADMAVVLGEVAR